MRSKPLLLGALLFLLTCVLDAWTKIWAQKTLVFGEITLIPGWAWLRLAYNEGVAFSFLDGVPPWLLGGGALLLLGVVVWSLREMTQWYLGAAALGLVSAGGLCNAIDRLWNGRVTDMISVWKWPIFNVADTSITIGVALLLLASRQVKRAAAEAAQPSLPAKNS